MLASIVAPGTVLGLGRLINGQRVQSRDKDGFWFNGRIVQHLEDDHIDGGIIRVEVSSWSRTRRRMCASPPRHHPSHQA